MVALAFSPDGRVLASADQHGAVKLWDVAFGEELLEVEKLDGHAELLQFAPDGGSLVAATKTGGGRFMVWHAASRDP